MRQARLRRDFLSGPGLTREHERRSGRRVPAIEIAALAARGDAAANETMACYEHRLARALAAIINVVDPDVIVLGGGLSNIERLYANVPRLWANWMFSAGAADVPRTRCCAPHTAMPVECAVLHGSGSRDRVALPS